MGNVITAMSGALGTMVTDVTDGLGTILPVVIPLAAAVIGIFVIWRVVRKFTGR